MQAPHPDLPPIRLDRLFAPPPWSPGIVGDDQTGLINKDIAYYGLEPETDRPTPRTIPIRRFLEHYDFSAVLRPHDIPRVDSSDRPSLFMRFPLPDLLKIYIYFSKGELAVVASAHGMHAGKRTIVQLKELIGAHVCSDGCCELYFRFQERSVVRVDVACRLTLAGQTVVRIRDPVLLPSLTRSLNAIESVYTEHKRSHLDPPAIALKRLVVSEWNSTLSPANFVRKPCAVCQRLTTEDNSISVMASDLDLTLLRNDDLAPNLLPTTYNLAAYKYAILDPMGLKCLDKADQMMLCRTCSRELKKGIMPRFALANFLYYARENLPPEVSQHFQESSVFERAMICRVRTNGIMCRFSEAATDPPSTDNYSMQNRHVRGNVVMMPLDTFQMRDILPPGPSDIADTLCAVFISKSRPTRATISKLSPVLVRKSRVRLLVDFLIANNPHYGPVSGFKGFSSERLNGLFSGERDRNLLAAVELGHLSANDAVDASTSDYTSRLDSVDGLLMENVGYTLGDHSASSLRDMKLSALQRCISGKTYLGVGAGSQAVPDFGNPYMLSWLFPHLDPWGIGGFFEPRRKRYISMEEQLSHLLQVRDEAFEVDHEFAFVFYNVLRKKAVNESLHFTVPVGSYAKVADSIMRLDAAQVAALKLKYRSNPMYQPATEEEKRILKVMSSVGPVAKHVQGSVAQRITMRNEIRATMNLRGCPSLFVTLNPSDIHNPVVHVLASRCADDAGLAQVFAMAAGQRLQSSSRHPVACAQYFDAVITGFIDIILRHGRGKGLYGTCSAYYGSVEAQGRGTLHCHMLIWLDGHPAPGDLKDLLVNDAVYKADLVRWLDSIMLSGFVGDLTPFNNMSSEDVEREINSRGEPHPGMLPNPDLSASSDAEFSCEVNAAVDELLLRFNWHKHRSTCWKYLGPRDAKVDSNCRFGMDGIVRARTEVDADTGKIVARRINARMTHFTDVVTYLVKSNTDVKFIGSGQDAKAFMYYVTEYITKPPLSMYAGLAGLCYVVQQNAARAPSLDDSPEKIFRRTMTSAVNSMLGHQEISHPQVMSYIVGGGEKYTNEQFVTVNWGEVVRFIESAWAVPDSDLGEEVALDEHVNDHARSSMSIMPEGSSFSVRNKRFDYMYRPADDSYNGLGFYNFLSLARKRPIRWDDNGYPVLEKGARRFCSQSHPQYRTHIVVARSHPAVPVLLGPSLPRKNGTISEKEDWAMRILILFKPWRSPADLKDQHTTWIDAYEQFSDSLSALDAGVIQNMSLLTEAKDARGEKPRESRVRVKDRATQFSMGALLEESMGQSEFESNVYSTAAASPGSADDASPYSATLKDLLGADCVDAFMLCQGVRIPLARVSTPLQEANDSVGVGSNAPTVEKVRIASEEAVMSIQMHESHFLAQPPLPESTEGLVYPSVPSLPVDFPPRATVDVLSSNFPFGLRLLDTVDPRLPFVDEVVREMTLESNPEQLKAFNIVAGHILGGGKQLLMYVSGTGGTGKSHLIQSIVRLMDRLGRRRELALGAPTGIAAKLIGGCTIHSLLMMTPGKKQTTPKGLMDRWRNVQYLIIDEVSMVGALFMDSISARLRTAKGDLPSNANKPFGGVNVIFMGDFGQLSPPKQKSLYAFQLIRDQSFSESRSQRGVSAVAGAFAWRQVDVVVDLKINKRQADDPDYAEILRRVRIGQSRGGVQETDRLVSGRTVIEHLRGRTIEHLAVEQPAVLASFQDAPVIVGSKVLRDALNAKLIAQHAGRRGENVYLYHSVDKVKGQLAEGSTGNYLWDLPSRKTQESLGRLPMFVGMKAMVTENVCIGNGVVNGAEGVVTDIVYHVGENGERCASAVYVRIEGCGAAIPGLEIDVVPLLPRAISISLPIRVGDNVYKSFRRTQIPLIPAYSYTDYKSQGRSLDRAIVDLSSARGQGVYVMLSRVRTLDGLLILRWFPASKVTQRLQGDLRSEFLRLKELEASTDAEYANLVRMQEVLRGRASE